MMNYIIDYILAGVLYTEYLAGIMVNVIILAAIFLKWKTRRSLQTCYKILSCLALSRSLHFLSVFFHKIIYDFFPWVLLKMVVIVALSTVQIFFHCTNLWFVAVLFVYYWVKITNYNNPLWISLKTKVSTAVSWLLLASMFFSISSCLLIVFCVFDLEPNNITNGAAENTTYRDAFIIIMQKQFLMFLLGSCPPFLIFCITISLLLHSLWMHTRRMRSSGSGCRSPNLESLFSAVKSMSLFLVLQIIYFILMSGILSDRLHVSKVWGNVTGIIYSFHPFFHSLYIIFSNSDLKKTCISMFHALTRAVPS